MKFTLVALLCIIITLTPSMSVLDHYKLSLQWPNTFCKSSSPRLCSHPVPQKFIIHAMWPFDENQKIFPDCTYGTFLNPGNVVNMEQSLDVVWPNLKRGKTNYEFWEYEFNKHARCLKIPANTYFSKAMEVKINIESELFYGSLSQTFIEEGLKPSYQVMYDPKLFLDKIRDEMNIVSEMQCLWNEQQAQMELYEIRFCVHPKKFLLVNCSLFIPMAPISAPAPQPVYQMGRCDPNKIQFPPPPPQPMTPSYSYLGVSTQNMQFTFLCLFFLLLRVRLFFGIRI